MIPTSPTRYITIVFAAAMLAALVMPVPALTITDDSGMPVTLNTTPVRIVSLSPSNTEIIAALGLIDRLVGVTDVCDYPPEAANITHIGGYSAISIEKVAAARPDVVFASDITPEETVDRLRELGIPVVVISPEDIDHVIRDIRLVGEVTGTGPEAEKLAGDISSRIAAALPSPPPVEKPTVAQVVWNDPLYVSGNNTLQNDVIVHAGGKNVYDDKSGWGTVSLEEFLLRNPDIIIVNGGGGMDATEKDVIRESFMTEPQYASLSAVKNGKVYAVNADIISRPGPRIADATEQVAQIIHPECFVTPATTTAPAGTTAPAQTPGFGAWLTVVVLTALGLLLLNKNGR